MEMQQLIGLLAEMREKMETNDGEDTALTVHVTVYSSLITGSDSKNSFPKIKATLSLPPLKHV
jgi:hypothetical protein